MEESSIATRPTFTWDDVAAVASKFGEGYTFDKDLPSERDQNFLLAKDSGPCAVFKIHNSAEDPAFVDCQNQALKRGGSSGALCQRLSQTSNGEDTVDLKGKDGKVFRCRMLSYLPGEVLAKVAARNPAANTDLWASVGRAVGSVSAALLDFDHLAAHRDFVWDIQHCERVITAHVGKVKGEDRQSLLRDLLDGYRKDIVPKLSMIRKSVVHNDPNDYNLVVDDAGVVGVLDFGDMVYTYTVADAAICAAYLLLHCPKDAPLVNSLVPFVQGYHEKCPFQKEELDVLYGLAIMRVCTSVCMSAYQCSLEPDNEYLSITEAPAWDFLERLASEKDEQNEKKRKKEDAGDILREACGLN